MYPVILATVGERKSTNWDVFDFSEMCLQFSIHILLPGINSMCILGRHVYKKLNTIRRSLYIQNLQYISIFIVVFSSPVFTIAPMFPQNKSTWCIVTENTSSVHFKSASKMTHHRRVRKDPFIFELQPVVFTYMLHPMS